MKDTDTGIWCKKDNCFYYLETCGHKTNNIERLKKILIKRDLISYTELKQLPISTQYRVIPVSEAKERNLDMKVIYISSHVKEVHEAHQEEASDKGLWKR